MMMNPNQTCRFRRGEIVWARAIFPRSWLPGLVSRTDPLGVLVSFFHFQIPSQYFLESDVCSFNSNFRSMTKNVERGSLCDELVNRALILLGRRIDLSLKCTCQGLIKDVKVTSVKRGLEEVSLFSPFAVVRFVVRVAVWPWIHDVDLVDVVKDVARVKCARRFFMVERKSVYRGERECGHGKDVELNSALRVNPVTQESDTLVVEDECQMFPEQDENDLAPCMINRRNIRPLVLKSSASSSHEGELNIRPRSRRKQRKKQTLHEMLEYVHNLAMDPFNLEEECLDSVDQYILRFRILFDKNDFDPPPKNFSSLKISEAPLSRSQNVCNSAIQSRVEVDEKAGDGRISPFIPYLKGRVNCSGLKRQLDQPATSDHCFKFRKTIPFSSQVGDDTYLHRNRSGWKVDISNPFLLLGSLAKLEIPNHPYSGARGLTFICTTSLMDLFQKMFKMSVTKHASYCDNNVIGKVQEHEESVDTTNDNATCLTLVKKEPEGLVGIPNANQTGLYCYNTGNGNIQEHEEIVDTNPACLALVEKEPEAYVGIPKDNHRAYIIMLMMLSLGLDMGFNMKKMLVV